MDSLSIKNDSKWLSFENSRNPRVDLPRVCQQDSDSSSRGRMGSPSGKSHDSSDSEHSWGRLHDR